MGRDSTGCAYALKSWFRSRKISFDERSKTVALGESMPQALIVLVLVLSMFSRTKTPNLDVPTAIDKVRYATVLIEARDDKFQHTRLETGFLVSSSGFVITNKHVVDAALVRRGLP